MLRSIVADAAAVGSGAVGSGSVHRREVARTVFDAWDSAVAVVRADGTIEVVNAAWERFGEDNGGDPASTGAGSNYFEVCERAAGTEPTAEAALHGLRQVLDGELSDYTLEYPFHSPSEQRWFRMTARTMDVDGDTRLLVIHDDVSDHKRMQYDMRARSLVLDAVDAAVVATDLGGVVKLWNRAAERLFGWSADQAIGRPVYQLLLPARDGPPAQDVLEHLADHQDWEGELTVLRANGTRFRVYVRSAFARDDEGLPTEMVAACVDVSARVAMEEQLARSNRELKAITDSIGDGLCTLDADGRITYINPEGQRLLGVYVTEALGVRLAAWLRNDGDRSIGVDELAAIDPDHPAECTVSRGDGTEQPIEYVVTPLVAKNDPEPSGWVVVLRDIRDRREREAEVAHHVEQARWLGRIRAALDTDGFVLFAQPIIDLHTGEVVQNELLLRMRDPDNPDQLIAPGRFLPTAEELGLAPTIDKWVLRHGLELAATGMPVQINLSATSLDDPTLSHLVEQLLRETGADPARVMFEITETALLASDVNAARFAMRVHELGCRLALDDFGTGYGGFTYLKQPPIDELKIDIEFVRDAVNNPASRHVIDAVVSLARAFGLRTVGEGVEDAATLETLRELDVDLAQGYHLGRPGPIAVQPV